MASTALIVLTIILVLGGIAVLFFVWALNSGVFHLHTPADDDDAPARLTRAANEAADASEESKRGAA